MKSSLCQIAQTQQAAAQTAISQVPVRNFPCGSHLLLWKIVAAELWSVRAEKCLFIYLFISLFFFPRLHRVTPPHPTPITVCVKYRRQLSAVGGVRGDVWLIRSTRNLIILYSVIWKKWSGEALRWPQLYFRLWCCAFQIAFSQRLTCQLEGSVGVSVLCFLPLISPDLIWVCVGCRAVCIVFLRQALTTFLFKVFKHKI